MLGTRNMPEYLESPEMARRKRDEPDYHDRGYWNRRYQSGAMRHWQWYCGYDALKPLLSPLLDEAESVLEIGCGDCPLARELRADGFAGELVAVDYVASCVRELRAEQQRRPPRHGLGIEYWDRRTPCPGPAQSLAASCCCSYAQRAWT